METQVEAPAFRRRAPRCVYYTSEVRALKAAAEEWLLPAAEAAAATTAAADPPGKHATAVVKGAAVHNRAKRATGIAAVFGGSLCAAAAVAITRVLADR